METELRDSDKKNFTTLLSAASHKEVCLVMCVDTLKSVDGEDPVLVPLVCAMEKDEGGVQFVPFAKLLRGNPYVRYEPYEDEENDDDDYDDEDY